MSGRGRGGKGGISKTMNREQLIALGVGNKELIPGPVLQPPMLFPLLERRPVPLNQTLEMDYLLILRQDFIDHMQLSGSYLKLPGNKTEPEQEIDKLVAQIPSTKEKYDWRLFPSELRPKVSVKRSIKKGTTKEVDVEQRLKVLETLEKKIESSETTGDREAGKAGDDDDEDADIPEVMEEDEEDEEMDDGTDYANNYFDNGEDYDDEDDNLEDGPIY